MKKLMYLIVILALASCDKDETTPEKFYEVGYFARGGQMEIYYNTPETEHMRTVKTFDTTFTCKGGWNILFDVRSLNDITCGVVINGDTVDGCINTTYCTMGMYLK